MNRFLQGAAALAFTTLGSVAQAHGDPGTHWHDDGSTLMAAAVVGTLFAGAALRLAWLALAALRRRAGARSTR